MCIYFLCDRDEKKFKRASKEDDKYRGCIIGGIYDHHIGPFCFIINEHCREENEPMFHLNSKNYNTHQVEFV